MKVLEFKNKKAERDSHNKRIMREYKIKEKEKEKTDTQTFSLSERSIKGISESITRINKLFEEICLENIN